MHGNCLQHFGEKGQPHISHLVTACPVYQATAIPRFNAGKESGNGVLSIPRVVCACSDSAGPPKGEGEGTCPGIVREEPQEKSVSCLPHLILNIP